MWIFSKNAFLSIVAVPDDDSVLLVRARAPNHIRNVFPGAIVTKTPQRDYRYRAIVDKDDAGTTINDMVSEIDYTNFKDSITDPVLHDYAGRVWEVMYQMQILLHRVRRHVVRSSKGNFWRGSVR